MTYNHREDGEGATMTETVERLERDRITEAAADLARRMGDGWEPHVWENSGWHYKICRGTTSIHADRHGRYSAWIEPDCLMGHCAAQFIAYADTPEDALGFAIQDARTFIARIDQALADVGEAP